MEETYSKFDIDSKFFSLTTVAFRGVKVSVTPFDHVIFDSGADVHVSNNSALFTPRNLHEYSKVIGIEGKRLPQK